MPLRLLFSLLLVCGLHGLGGLSPLAGQDAAPTDTTPTEVTPATTEDPPTASPPAEGEAPTEGETPEAPTEETKEPTLGEKIDKVIGTYIAGPIWTYFLGIPIFGMPLITWILVVGSIFFTIRFMFPNIILFGHSFACIRGKFDNPDDDGEISHFKALTSALSATVGLGNIAGVAVAIAAGGPGAVFWMWCIAVFGMVTKFSSCTLSQLYRRVKGDGSVIGGPFVYLQDGIKDRFPALAPLGVVFAIIAAIFTIMASFGGGNMFQGKMTYAIAGNVIDGLKGEAVAWIFGLVLAVLVGLVVVGGIKRIGNVTAKIIPLMCGAYVLVCLILIVANIGKVPGMFGAIFTQAFSPAAAFGGILGVIATGVQRAAFSNEAGLGSAAIAHAAAKTKEPVREGVVAMLGPFIDTIIVCTMTALAILITDVYTPGQKMGWTEGAVMTAEAFGTLHIGFKYFLVVAVFFFAYSTMISWSYYGERATEFLFGEKGILPYRIVYSLLVIIGPVMSIGSILDFADFMLLSMAVPNIIGMILLSGIVKAKLDDYTKRLKSGEMKPVK